MDTVVLLTLNCYFFKDPAVVSMATHAFILFCDYNRIIQQYCSRNSYETRVAYYKSESMLVLCFKIPIA